MICLRCGKPIENAEDICPMCGSRIPQNYQKNIQNNNVRPNSENNSNIASNNVTNSIVNDNVKHNNVINNPQSANGVISDNSIPKLESNDISNDKLREVYIGEKHFKFVKGGITFYPFFFGVWYLLYRKMYLFSLLLIIASMIMNEILDSNIVLIINLVINILLIIFFKKIYIKHVDKKIEKIRLENPNVSFDTLQAICINKGGVNKFFGVLIGIGIVIFVTSLIATPLILRNIVNKAQDGADERTVESYGKGIEAAYYTYVIENNGNYPESLYDIKDNVDSNVQCDSMDLIDNNIVLTGCTVEGSKTKYDYHSLTGVSIQH